MAFSKIVWFSLLCCSDLLQELLKVQSGKVVLFDEQVSTHDTITVLAVKKKKKRVLARQSYRTHGQIRAWKHHVTDTLTILQ